MVADHGEMNIDQPRCLGDLYRKLPEQVKRVKHHRQLASKIREGGLSLTEQDTTYLIDRCGSFV